MKIFSMVNIFYLSKSNGRFWKTKLVLYTNYMYFFCWSTQHRPHSSLTVHVWLWKKHSPYQRCTRAQTNYTKENKNSIRNKGSIWEQDKSLKNNTCMGWQSTYRLGIFRSRVPTLSYWWSPSVTGCLHPVNPRFLQEL